MKSLPKDSKQNKIKVICSKKGCPRTRMIDKQETDPIKAVKMEMACPWHEGWNGEFDTPNYYDKDGNQVGTEIEDFKEGAI